jgi:hypothetical protein
MTYFNQTPSTIWRDCVVLLLVLGSLIFVMLQAPIKQDLAYHLFIDTRSLFGIANFYNVISNLPFLLVGATGLVFCFKQAPSDVKAAWLTFFAGVTLVSVGSVYYHLNPSNQSLVWDRLPMTIGFMGLFAGLLGEFVDSRIAKHGLLPLLLMGFSSVLVWYWFDDLRFYAWVQFMPLLVIPAMLMLYRKQFSHSYLLIFALLFYLLAKMLEAYDAQIFTLFQNEMGGHAIKHVFAALGSGVILCMLRVRKSMNV